ncbi:hypothetical protein [Rhizobium sp. BK529]|uniref:hypothetical protein n=1 Tax=Rhizobium sp. BK529 TaxID=2586983 RepID=UPI001404AFE6|nr:hypothetical protein [Rhizobium sp. BK529]
MGEDFGILWKMPGAQPDTHALKRRRLLSAAAILEGAAKDPAEHAVKGYAEAITCCSNYQE